MNRFSGYGKAGSLLRNYLIGIATFILIGACLLAILLIFLS